MKEQPWRIALTRFGQFLMRYYTPGDDIFFFGFSRGAYTARFLAEMLDHVGLLSVSACSHCKTLTYTFGQNISEVAMSIAGREG